MITNPSCQSETKDTDPKFHAPHFDDDLGGDLGGGPGGGGQGVGQGGLTDLSGYGQFVGGHGGGGQHGHYNGHYYNSWNSHGGHPGHTHSHAHQTSEYNNYYPTQQTTQSVTTQYYGGGGGINTHHYTHVPAPGLPLQYHQDAWPAGAHPSMVLPPGPSPTGSNNSPSPHGFNSDNGEPDHRTDLKRPSPDTFVPHTSLGPGSTVPGSIHHQATVAAAAAAKKPKVSKRRKKRDPNEPQKPVSAYALFFRDTQASIKLRNPNANFGEVSKIVAATWDALDPESKAAYKKRTEMAKKEYLRALAAYRANLVSKGSGHDLYGGFPGYSPMLFNGSPMEQAMPATGLGPLGPGNISPGSLGQGPGPTPQMVQGLPPHYNGSYHPSYMQQNIQIQHGGNHLQQPQHSPGPDIKSEIKMEDQLSGGNHDSYENGHFRPPTAGGGGHYPPPHSQGGQYPGYQGQQQQQQSGGGGGGVGNGEHTGPGQYGNKCGRLGCRNYIPGHSEYCSSDCVLGESKEVYDNWSSCMVKHGPNTGGQNPDVMVK